jgi:hypothetical protein
VSSGCPLSRSKDSERGSGEDDITVITWGEQSGSHEMMVAPAPGCSLIHYR